MTRNVSYEITIVDAFGILIRQCNGSLADLDAVTVSGDDEARAVFLDGDRATMTADAKEYVLGFLLF